MTACKDPEKEKEHRRKLQESNKKTWSDPKLLKKHSDMIVKQYADDPTRSTKLSSALKLKWDDPEYREQGIARVQEASKKPEWIKKNKQAALNRASDPAWVELMTEINRAKANDPQWIQTTKFAAEKRAKDPVWLQHNKDARIRIAADPVWREQNAKRHRELAKDPEWIKKHNATHRGENCNFWKGGISFLPYCFRFNNPRRIATRRIFGNCCICCGKHVTENISRSKKHNGYRQKELHVHHITHDKEEGCEGKPFNLVPLCDVCHSKEKGHQEEYIEYINKTLAEGFKWGIWSKEQYVREVMYPE